MSGRRAYRGRRSVPGAFIAMGFVIVAAVILIIINLNKDKTAKTPDTDEPQVIDPVVTEPVEPEPQIPVIEVFGDIQEYDSVYCVGNTGYEMYTYVDDTAKKYAQCVNKVADNLSGSARVFDIVVPLSSGVTLPDELYGQNFLSDQEKAEDTILSYMDDNVITVPVYDTLMLHRNEYIYYRTDHHWTGLGAYYAYTQLCKAAGLTAHDISDYTAQEMPGFLGTFYNDTGKSATLGDTPDTVTAYYPIGGATMDVYDGSGAMLYDDIDVICDESTAPAAFKYGAYIWGDNAYSVITNPTITDGSACVLIKESFGNAFAPFLVDHYQTVYVIDYRHWSGSITEFVKQNGIKDVVFCNNLSAIRNSSLIGELFGVL